MKVGVKASTSPNPLSRAPRVYHVSTMKELSFNPANFGQSPLHQSTMKGNHLKDPDVAALHAVD